MNKYILDITQLNLYKHDYLKQLFDFPEYYGNNLDALYDCLSELFDYEIIIINVDDVDAFSLDVLRVIDDLAEEREDISISYEYDEEIIDD